MPISLPHLLKNVAADLRQMNLLLLVMVGILAAVGVLFVYDVGQQAMNVYPGLQAYWRKQLLWIGLGSAAMLTMAALDYEWLGRYAHWLYLVSVVMLVAVLFCEPVNFARSWIKLPGGISLQPSELAKLGVLVVVARLAARPAMRMDYWGHVGMLLLLMGLPLMLIGLQPDYGSAMLLVPITLAVLLVAGLPTRWIVAAGVVVLLLSPIVYRYGLKSYQRERLHTFVGWEPVRDEAGHLHLNRVSDPLRHGWNARQSLLAVGSGGVWGKGFGAGTQNPLGFLPRKVAPTDFIFAVIAEETGFLGGSLVVLGQLLILILALLIAGRARDEFGRNLACGIAVMFCGHIYINIGMTMGMAPIIGIPLPFVSYGGSFMLLTLSCVGVLQSIWIRRRRH